MNIVSNVRSNAKKIAGATVAVVASASSSFAQATGGATNYASELTSNLNTINTIWGAVATIMIGSALVAVGVKFFRKAK